MLVLGANVTTQVLKRYVLPRPDLLPTDLREGGPSFPSGHSTVAMSLALALVLVVPRSLRTLAAVAGLVYAVGVGVAVIVAGWHRAFAAGALTVGGLGALLVGALLRLLRGISLDAPRIGTMYTAAI